MIKICRIDIIKSFNNYLDTMAVIEIDGYEVPYSEFLKEVDNKQYEYEYTQFKKYAEIEEA